MRILQAILIAALLLAFSTASAAEMEGVPSGEMRNLLASATTPGAGSSQDFTESQPNAEEELALRDIIELAFERNPEIRAARASWRAMVEMYPQATSLPDPNLKLNWFPEPIETRNGSNDFAIQLMQMIPNPRRLDLMGDITLTRAEMARVSYEKTVRDVLTDIMTSYFELGYLQNAIDIAATNEQLFEQLVELGSLEYSNASIGLSELYSAESRLAQAEYEEMLLMELLYSERSNMRNLLGVDPDYPIPAVIQPYPQIADLNLEQLRESALDHRHELEMAGISVEIADLGVSLARAMDDPNFSLGLMYNFIGTSPMDDAMRTNGDDAWGVMFGISIPIWGQRNNARIDQAQWELERALAKLEDQENQAYADVDRLYWRLQNQRRLVELYRNTLLPEAISAAELSQTWYEDGQIPFSNLVETRLVVQNFQLAFARAEADYLKSLVELQKLTGLPVFGDSQEAAEQ